MDNILEEKDPKFDAMLGQMVSRIKSKPGKAWDGWGKFKSNWFLLFQYNISWCRNVIMLYVLMDNSNISNCFILHFFSMKFF